MNNWVEIKINTTVEASEIIENILFELGSSGISIEGKSLLEENLDDNLGTIVDIDEKKYSFEGVLMRGYIEKTDFSKDFFEKLKEKIKSISNNFDIGYFFNISYKIIKDEDWENSWKDFFEILEIGDNFVIVPTWKKYKNENNKNIIRIDPGMAFGTGGHETTTLCIKNLEKYLNRDDDVIDVGCGSGILTIVSSYLTCGKLKAVDLDEKAVEISKENFKVNNILDRVSVQKANLLENERDNYNVIVSNILPHIIEKMLEDAYKLLEKNGYFIVSGIIKNKKDDFLKKAIKKGFIFKEEIHQNDWCSLVFTK